MSPSNFVRISAVIMFVGIGLGAFGAHGLREVLEQNGTADAWNAAAKYHLIHGVALFALASSTLRRKSGPFWCWVAGILLFSGSLYGLALTDLRILGPVTPVGGVLFMAGWVWLIFRPGEGRD